MLPLRFWGVFEGALIVVVSIWMLDFWLYKRGNVTKEEFYDFTKKILILLIATIIMVIVVPSD